MLTVAELIEQLKKLPQEVEVLVEVPGNAPPCAQLQITGAELDDDVVWVNV